MDVDQTGDRAKDGGKEERRITKNEIRGHVESNATASSPPTRISSNTAQMMPTPSRAEDGIRLATSSSTVVDRKPRLRLKATSSNPTAPAATVPGSWNQTYTSNTQFRNSTAIGAGGQAKLDTIPLPGKNQNVPRLNMTSIGTSPAAAIARPVPGKNQSRPILDEIATSLTQLVEPQPLSTLSWPTSASSTSTSSPSRITSSSITTSIPTSSFTTLTRSQPGQGQAPVLPDLGSSSQATLAASSLSSALSSILVVTSVIAAPTGHTVLNAAVNAELRQRTRLTPLARTLFIVFGALGAAALLIAFGVVVVLQVKKKRAREAIERPTEQYVDYFRNDVDPSFGDLGFTTEDPSSNTYRNSFHDNPFLTESEKAIVARAVTPAEEQDSRLRLSILTFNDDVKAFIAKSRRLTYKISP